jgi:DNA polymerase III sliding clamp (beta) subunit (PCNA family)
LKAFLKSLDESSGEKDEESEASSKTTIDPKREYFGHDPLVADDFPRLENL